MNADASDLSWVGGWVPLALLLFFFFFLVAQQQGVPMTLSRLLSAFI